MKESRGPLRALFYPSGGIAALLGSVAFVTMFTTIDEGIMRLPIKLLLKDQLGLKPVELSLFFALALIPVYLKPLFGLLSDNVPLFGSHRISYMVFGCTLASVAWLLLPLIPHRFGWLLPALFVITLLISLTGSTAGALMVDVGQANGTSGRLVSVFSVGNNVANLAGSVLGGYFVGMSLGWVCGIAATITISLVPILYLFREADTPRNREVKSVRMADICRQFRELRNARSFWITLAILFCVFMAPGLSTPLLYIQTDVNHFSPRFLGWLGALSGGMAIASGLIYITLSGRMTLRTALIGSILFSATAALGYLHYRTAQDALIVDLLYAAAYEFICIVVMNLAVRTIPKGSEGFVFGIVWSLFLVVGYGSDLLGSWMYGTLHWAFPTLVGLNVATTLVALMLVPLLPDALLKAGEGTAYP
ncbi:MAG: folate transporter [Holophagaceae bacterium]|nr:folate transporter [Holophagaceae bacterium]